MRSTTDRIRQAVLFEGLGLALSIPFFALVLGHPMHELGALAIIASLVATVWNYVYNLIFDHALLRFTGGVQKTLLLRVVHAVLFETALLLALLPVAMWVLGVGLWQAFIADIGFSAFYLVWAFVFTWGYDRVFPPETPAPQAAGR
ncbi:Uncharacterized membrane protein [Palleronia marisminoris]|uniref:Bacterial Transmembrane Pair family protein n=1 Tax=Palleronia marisminoris TaxID=315423 RepID=A0A1Y5RLQ0_9RHOB|nr:PACE efflux transporter [Palleronia marisminoris]SFG22347.1 Uncharacterized membrane protein [Palleronia marisminoris]SLN17720.1 Bacterial Transmembrane Pair family protein [Palleronia marisminoris]